jgi:hypothetical protein
MANNFAITLPSVTVKLETGMVMAASLPNLESSAEITPGA